MDKTSKILLLLVFLALTANLLRPLFFPGRASADEPYQVAVLKSRFNRAVKDLEGQIQKLEMQFEKHNHKIEVCDCDPDVPRMMVETSTPD